MSRSPFARIAVLAGILGCSFLFIKVALDGVSATQVVLARIVLGALTLLGYCAVRRERLPPWGRTWMHLAFMGIVANVLPFLGFSWGEGHGATSGLAGIYNATTPLWMLLFAMAVLPAERATRAGVVGLVLVFLGVRMLLAPWRPAEAPRRAGHFPCLGAGACYGVAFVW